jgi:hypothetical protein
MPGLGYDKGKNYQFPNTLGKRDTGGAEEALTDDLQAPAADREESANLLLVERIGRGPEEKPEEPQKRKKGPGFIFRVPWSRYPVSFCAFCCPNSCYCKKWGSARRSNRPHVPHATIAIQAPYSSHDWFRDKDFLKRDYVELQKSTAQIAREIGCARSTVVKYLLEFGIELRRDGLPANYRKSQLAYGERIHNGKVVPHLGELRIIEAMVKRRRDGATYAELAQWANSNKVPTKNRTGKWDRRTIWEILGRYCGQT